MNTLNPEPIHISSSSIQNSIEVLTELRKTLVLGGLKSCQVQLDAFKSNVSIEQDAQMQSELLVQRELRYHIEQALAALQKYKSLWCSLTKD